MNTLQNKNILLYALVTVHSKAYSLPKIQKKKIPYKIIVFSIGTAFYPLGTFLHELISKNIPFQTSHVNNSFDLYKSLSNIKIFHS